MEISADAYLWIKAVHILAVISWMAGFLYLPRLFVYHCGSTPGSEASETFKIMERRLLRAIMNPAMVVSILLGGVMVYVQSPEIWMETWFQIKLVSLVLLIVVHIHLAKWRRAFETDTNEKSEKFFRFINEVPAVLMVIIVIMVIVKPF